ncbi:hypothetical protein TWF696_001068 [Orbilia brochopaga]|uniref:Uncharacterized protein n=1 Tax=Orbilia brochopaga TaxID=3140254 RepID=A0AAV9VFK1_9PEZI
MSEELQKLADSVGTPKRHMSSCPLSSTSRREDPDEPFDDIQTALDDFEAFSCKLSEKDRLDADILIFAVCVRKLGTNIKITFGQLQQMQQRFQAEREVLLALERDIKKLGRRLEKSKRTAESHAEDVQEVIYRYEDVIDAAEGKMVKRKKRASSLVLDV